MLTKIWLGLIHLFRYTPFFVSCRSFLWRMALNKCGKDLMVFEGVVLRKPENIEIGNNVSLNEFCYLHGRGGIIIGNNVRIAPYVGIFSFNHKFSDKTKPIIQQGFESKPIVVGDDCWLGADTKILAGVKIGKGSVIGAGSIVVKDIPENSVAVGNPAEVIKKRGS